MEDGAYVYQYQFRRSSSRSRNLKLERCYADLPRVSRSQPAASTAVDHRASSDPNVHGPHGKTPSCPRSHGIKTLRHPTWQCKGSYTAIPCSSVSCACQVTHTEPDGPLRDWCAAVSDLRTTSEHNNPCPTRRGQCRTLIGSTLHLEAAAHQVCSVFDNTTVTIGSRRSLPT